MIMKKSPLAIVKERFGDDRKAAKAKLVQAVRTAGADLWVAGEDESSLDRVSNAKLIHLESTFQTIKKEHGSRAKLVDAVLAVEKRSKDEGYRTHLERQSTLRLWDRLRTLKKKAS
jgi:hypothetical protein